MKSKIILVILMLGFISVSAFASVVTGGSSGTSAGVQSFGAPLDGGLLSVLGAAGIAYFVARRKKKKLDQ